MSILDKLLEKRGIKNLEDLSAEERAIFDNYKVILTGKEITLAQLRKFIEAQIGVIEDKFAGPPSPNDGYLKACLHVYLTLLKVFDAPKVERENLEKYLISLIQIN